MGVTIHFEGKLRSADSLQVILREARDWAAAWHSEAIALDAPSKKLTRVVNETEFDYEGPVTGVQLMPHKDSEPLILEFDDQLVVQEYCKTQFAPIATHMDIVRFLRAIEPQFEWFDVFDEGGYWETGDAEVLRKAFSDFEKAKDAAIAEDPELSGPVRHSSGRIIDLMKSRKSGLN
jgi:hypothetical protein